MYARCLLLLMIALSAFLPACPAGDGLDELRRSTVTFDPDALERACDRGEVEGCAKIAPYYEDACQAGQGTRCHKLSEFLRAGKGVARDEARADEMAARACELGVKEACPGWAPLAGEAPRAEVPEEFGELFADCQEVDAPNAKAIQCPVFVAAVLDLAPWSEEEARGEFDALVQEAVASIEARGGGARSSEQACDYGGEGCMGVKYVASFEENTGFTGYYVAWPEEGGYRALTCAGRTSRTDVCPSVLQALSTWGLDEALAAARRFERRGPSAVGRALEIPEGCRGSHNAIQCANSHLLVAELPEGEDLEASRVLMVEDMKARMSQSGLSFTEHKEACTIEGVQTECWRFDSELPDGRRARATVALDRVRGALLAARCDQVFKGEEPSEMAPMCRQVLGP